MTKKNFDIVTGAAIMLFGMAIFFGGMIFERGYTLFWLIAALSIMAALNLLAKRWQDKKK